MSTLLSITIYIAWFASAVFYYAEYTYLWQLKEYRLDRFKDFLSTRQGKRYILTLVGIRHLVIAFFLLLIPLTNSRLLQELVAGILVLDFLLTLYQFFRRKIHRPKRTKKALLIMSVGLLFEGLLVFFIFSWEWIFSLIAFRFVYASIAMSIFSVPTKIIKHIYIQQAKKKISNFSHLNVIGITGSYGKSSTKKILDHILSQSYRVISTPKNINTEIGVALFILKSDFAQKDFFIVEMGAYRTGEIKLLCDMVNPDIGILTAINEQHLSLFGSLKNIQKAKYELLRALPNNGFGVTNSDNPYCREFLDQVESPVYTFGTEREFNPSALIHSIDESKDGILIGVTMHSKEESIDIPLPGAYQAYNVVAAMLVAHHLGMAEESIKEAIRTIPKEIASIQVRQFGKATILDDSYNSNPTGFKAALDVLSSYKHKRKIVITRGMIELGDASDEIHEDIGGNIAFAADELILISREHEAALKRGLVSEKYKTISRTITDISALESYIMDLQHQDVVVLIENRLPAQIYSNMIALSTLQ